jgi:hypothetical protein
MNIVLPHVAVRACAGVSVTVTQLSIRYDDSNGQPSPFPIKQIAPCGTEAGPGVVASNW